MAIDNEQRHKDAIRETALPVMLARLGGEVTFTTSEFSTVIAEYGGRTALMEFEELTGTGVEKRTFRVRLVRQAPGSGAVLT